MVVADQAIDPKAVLLPIRVHVPVRQGLDQTGEGAHRRQPVGVQRPEIEDQPLVDEGGAPGLPAGGDPLDQLRREDADLLACGILRIGEGEVVAPVGIFGVHFGGEGQRLPRAEALGEGFEAASGRAGSAGAQQQGQQDQYGQQAFLHGILPCWNTTAYVPRVHNILLYSFRPDSSISFCARRPQLTIFPKNTWHFSVLSPIFDFTCAIILI